MGPVRRNIIWGSNALGILLMAATANAAPITWEHVYDASPDVYFASGGGACTSISIASSCASFDFFHDLTTDGFVPGALSSDQITGGSLTVRFFDDLSDPGNQAEMVKIDLDALALGGTESGSQTFTLGSFTLAMLTSLQQDGILAVTLRHQAGDFYFDKSTLIADGTREDAETTDGTTEAVPEPAILMLFGAAAIGFARRARRLQRPS